MDISAALEKDQTMNKSKCCPNSLTDLGFGKTFTSFPRLSTSSPLTKFATWFVDLRVRSSEH